MRVSFLEAGEPLTKDVFTEKTSSLNRQQLHTKLMTFDLRFDTLSEYLSNFAQVINHHASLINGLHDDSRKKATKKELAVSLKQPAEAFDIVDPEFNTQVKLNGKAPRPTDMNESLEDRIKGSTNNLSNKMDQSKVAFSLLFNQNLELFSRLERAENRIKDLDETKTSYKYVDKQYDQIRNLLFDKTDQVQKVGKILILGM